MDGDGTVDIPVVAADRINLYDYQWDLQEEEFVTGFNDGQPAFNSNNDLIVHNGSHVRAYSWNGTHITLEASQATGKDLGTAGWACDSSTCYIRYDGGYMEWDDTYTKTYHTNGNLSGTASGVPVIANIDGDGATEILFMSTSITGYAIFEVGDDDPEYLNTGLTYRGEPLIYNLNGGTNSEIFWVGGGPDPFGGRKKSLYCYDISGASCAGFPIQIYFLSTLSGSTSFSNSNVIPVRLGANNELCFSLYARWYYTGGNPYGDSRGGIYCYNETARTANSIIYSDSWTGASPSEQPSSNELLWMENKLGNLISAAEFTSGGSSYDEVITSGSNGNVWVWDLEEQEITHNGTTSSYGTFPVDIDDDGYFDLLTAKSSGMHSEITSNAVCGNNVTQSPEQCDGTDLNSETCVTQGFDTGTLFCYSNCSFNVQSCANNPPGGGGGGGGGFPGDEDPVDTGLNDTLTLVPGEDEEPIIDLVEAGEDLVEVIQAIIENPRVAAKEIGQYAQANWLELLLVGAVIGLITYTGGNAKKPKKKRKRR
jgi:hypothetical protein